MHWEELSHTLEPNLYRHTYYIVKQVKSIKKICQHKVTMFYTNTTYIYNISYVLIYVLFSLKIS